MTARRRHGGRALALVALLLAAAVANAAPAAGRWGWLGVRIRDLSEQEMNEISKRHGLREGFGALIVEVIKETPAEVAGLRSGDLVVAFRDRLVVDTRTLQRFVAATGVGETVTLTVLRRDQGRRPVEVRLGAMPDAVAAERVAAEYGFLLRQPDPQPELGGVAPPARLPTVAVVLPKTPAAAAGLRVGDVLEEIGGKPASSLDAVRGVLLELSDHAPLPIVVRRDRERVPMLLEDPTKAP